jgi:hypothetical protein
MVKKIFKSKKLKYLPNIFGLEKFRDSLFKSHFEQKANYFSRSTPDKKLVQKICLKEDIDLDTVKNNIQKENLEGYMFPTNMLENILGNHPLPLSAQKQALVDMLSRMNNNKLNEAEGINLVYKINQEETPLVKNEKLQPLSPNFCSQLASTLHFNQKSRLTMGESHLINPENGLPFGTSLLQISHLTYHALDIDLSVGITPENETPTKTTAMLHEYSFTMPYSLKNNNYSDHGYILHLKGKNITPKKIQEIIGFKNNAFAGISIVTGEASGNTLAQSTTQNKFFKKKKTTKFHTKNKKAKLLESIGTYIYDKTQPQTSNGLLVSEKIGNITSIDGEIVLIMFPLLQTFTFQYSDHNFKLYQSE